MNVEPDAADDDLAPFYAAMARTNAPGLVLMAAGFCNVMVALALLFQSYLAWRMTPAALWDNREQTKKALPWLQEALDQEAITPDEHRQRVIIVNLAGGSVLLPTALVVFFGGARMRALRAYGLCVTAAVLAMVPCLSPCGCCGIGQVAGVYALVILLQPDVRAAFG